MLPFASATLQSGTVIPYSPDDWMVIASQAAPVDGIIEISGLDLTEFQRVVIVIDGLRADTEDVILWFRALVGGVPIVAGYRFVVIPTLSANTTAGIPVTSASETGIELAISADSQTNFSFSMRIEVCNPTSALYKEFQIDGARLNESNEAVRTQGGGILESAGAIDGFLLNAEGALLTAGQATVYGEKLGSRAGSPISPSLLSMWSGALS